MRALHLAAFAMALGAIAGRLPPIYVKIESKSEFAALIRQHQLERLGVTLTLTPDGGITGRAFGKPVTGSWDWKGGFFCRDMAWGEKRFDYNCQVVARNGDALRFTADRGQGEFGQLYLAPKIWVRLRSRWRVRSSRNRRNAQVRARRARQARPAARRPAPWRGAGGLGQRPLGGGGKVAGQVVSAGRVGFRRFLHSGDGQARRPCAGSPGDIRRAGGGTRRCKDASVADRRTSGPAWPVTARDIAAGLPRGEPAVELMSGVVEGGACFRR